VTDRKIGIDGNNDGIADFYRGDIASIQDYYSFGMVEPGRSYTVSNGYRFGFDGQEKDNEASGSGNSYTAEYWQYDPRLVRRWNTDPTIKPIESPYMVFGDNPIWFVDPNGSDTSFASNHTKDIFNEAYNDVHSKINEQTSKINDQLQKWKEKGYSNAKTNRLYSKRIEKLNEKRSELFSIKNGLDDLINSDMVFRYNEQKISDKFMIGGGTIYDDIDNVVYITFNYGNKDDLIHESRHGWGFLQGEWSTSRFMEEFAPKSYRHFYVYYGYDYSDEVNAYNWGYIYNWNYVGSQLRIMNCTTIKQFVETKYVELPIINKTFDPQYPECNSYCK